MVSREFERSIEQSMEHTRKNGRLTKIYERVGLPSIDGIEKRPILLTVPTTYSIGRYAGELDQKRINLSPDELATSVNHAILNLDERGNLFICDWESRNGTFYILNGKPIPIERNRWVAICSDDVYTFGKNTQPYQFKLLHSENPRAGWKMLLHNPSDATVKHAPVQVW